MRRAEAHQRLDERVVAWTAANGVYSGVFEEIRPTRPWRAVVKIDGVCEPAIFELRRAGRQRKGMRIGDRIVVGHSSVVFDLADGAHLGRCYLDSLRAELAKLKRWLTDPNDKNAGWLPQAIDCREGQIRECEAELELRESNA